MNILLLMYFGARSHAASLLMKVCALGVLCLAILPLKTTAHEEPKDVSKMISEMRDSIIFVSVVVIPADVAIDESLSESQLNRRGCAHFVGSKEEIGSIVDILANGRIIETEPFYIGEKRGIDARLGIYLGARSGAKIRLIFTAVDGAPQAQYGWLDDDTSVRAMNEQFPNEIHDWAAQHTLTVSPSCRTSTLNPRQRTSRRP